ncbi:TPA: tlde1 domain-containing protein [Citrobacter freundii]
MWKYDRKSKTLTHNGSFVAYGYSGKGAYKDHPEYQNIKSHHGGANAAPLPAGTYIISPPFNSPATGPYAMRLKPSSSNQMFGRGDFEIHGDKIADPGNASDGCIILGPSVRKHIWMSGDRGLIVE